MFDLFHDGLPNDLATSLELDAPPWLFLNTPIEMLVGSSSEDLPDTLDIVGGRFAPGPGADLSQCERSALFHFGGDDQEPQRRRLLAELALSRGLLVPDLASLYCVQFHLPCEQRKAREVAQSLMALGFACVAIIVGSDSIEASDPEDGYVVVRSRVEDEDGTPRLIVDGASKGVAPLRDRITSERLRSRVARIIDTMHLPKRLPVVINLSPSE